MAASANSDGEQVRQKSRAPRHADRPGIMKGGVHVLKLRAERDGDGPGRVYTIAVESRDYSGNSSVAMVTVTVPHRP